MVDRSGHRARGIAAVAAMIAGLAAIVLIALGLWLRHWQLPGDGPRWAEPRWWAGAASQALGYLALGKGGFKAAFAVLLGISAVTVWIRGRRRAGEDNGDGAGGGGSTTEGKNPE